MNTRFLIAAALVGLTVTASAEPMQAQIPDSVRRVLPDSGERVRGGRRGMRSPGRRDGVGPRDGSRRHGTFGRGDDLTRSGLLRGITLSDQQRSALRAARVKRLTAMKPLQSELLASRIDAEIAEINGDQKALDAANTRVTGVRERLAKLTEGGTPVTDLRSVLSADQQKTLDQNLSEMSRRDVGNRRFGREGGEGRSRMRGPRSSELRDRSGRDRRNGDGDRDRRSYRSPRDERPRSQEL